MHSESGASRGIFLERAGLRLVADDGRVEHLPLRAGAAHYWRLDPRSWRPALEALVSMELRLVETYVPWQIHERVDEEGAPPRYVFDGALDVAAFLREAHAVGLKAILRPGPHINAELTDFGLPERVLWQPDCQARTPRQNPVFLPAPPRAFPVPSYASRTFLDETARWFQAVGDAIGDLVWPAGPVVLVQVDNEGALYFRDALYDQDYHPDALRHYRETLRARYGTVAAMRAAYGAEACDPVGGKEADGEKASREKDAKRATDFDGVEPPTRYDARRPEDLARHLDWADSQESLLAASFGAMADAIRRTPLGAAPLFHNLPMGESATALHPARIRGGASSSPTSKGRDTGLDLIGMDFYHTAGQHRIIARRSCELAVACDALDHPAFAAEMGAGAPPYFPPLDERDAQFTALCAMAYGVRGYNVYMAVERDRWIGSPVSRDGVLRPFATFWRKLGAAHERLRFGELVRDTPARLLVPRSVRRLARVMHAFGPVSQALFRVLGAGLRETVLEDEVDFGDGDTEAPPLRAGRVLATAEHALDEEGVAYALVDGGDALRALEGARWVLVPASCGLDANEIAAIRKAKAAGARVTYAPKLPTHDAAFRPLTTRVARTLPAGDVLGRDESTDVAEVRRHVHDQPWLREVSRVVVRPHGCAATVHRDGAGGARVVFFINPTKSRQRLEVGVGGAARVRDVLDGTVHALEDGVIVDGEGIRFCEVVG